jgi:LPS export ABC transporter protein LptC
MKYVVLLVVGLFVVGCSTDIAEVNAITDTKIFKQEEAAFVRILYSDSADVKVRITADRMIRHLTRTNPRDEFPDGIFVEFLGSNGQVYSWLEADRAIRYDKSNEVVAQGNAKFYNRKKETLTSTELFWDEDKSKLHTNKAVRITQPMRGDTIYGFGFESNEEFTLFTIKNKASSILNAQNMKSKIDKGK